MTTGYEIQIRFEPTILGRFQPQWRKHERDHWKDVFITAFDTIPEAKLWARREYGSANVDFRA